MTSKTKRKVYIVAIVIFVALFALLYIYAFVLPKINGALVETQTVTFGEMSVESKEKCVIVRDETAVYAKESGTIGYYAVEGEKNRAGSKVLDIYTAAGANPSSYKVDSTGFVSYYVDGYEDFFTLSNIPQLEPTYLAENFIVPEDTTRKKAAKGEALYKLVKGNVWYIVLYVDINNSDKYLPGKDVTVDFGNGHVRGNIEASYPRGEYSLVVIKTGKFYENFAKIRQLDVNIIIDSFEGLKVPLSAIKTEEEQEGVYVLKTSGDYEFTPVSILTKDDNTALIKTGEKLKVYDEILKEAI